jgi:tRNA nucleotidyltransferase (CCA-adding enzyme)
MEFKLPEFVVSIFEKFQKNGFEIYLVGGAVRDLLLKRTVYDWDFTTNATPTEILKVFPEGYYHNKFGTVGISDPSAEKPYEITTYRKEVGYSDRRHPDKIIWGTSLEEDLSRRDFTVNALALTIDKDHKTQIIDPFDGQKDLERKIIKAVGKPSDRFSEDALRMMRAIRIATEIGFSIDQETFQAIKDNAPLINHIAKERIKEELFKLLKSDYPADGLTLLHTSGLLELLIPELLKGYGLTQAKHHIYDVWTHSLMALKNCPNADPLVRFATLIHDIGKPVVARGEGENRTFYNHEMESASIAGNLADRFRFSKKEKDLLVTLVRWHMFTCDDRQTDSAIRRFIKNVGKENLKEIIDLRVGDRLGGGAKETSWRLEEFKKRLIEVQKQPFSINDLKVNGKDVMKILKIQPGPKVGQVLNKLFKEVEEDMKKNTKQQLLKRIKEIDKI